MGSGGRKESVSTPLSLVPCCGFTKQFKVVLIRFTGLQIDQDLGVKSEQEKSELALSLPFEA